jgi:hypothetical protein
VVFGPDTISKEKNISILNSFGVTECFGMLLEKSFFFLFICGDGCRVCVLGYGRLKIVFSSRVAKDNELVEHRRLLLEEKKMSETLNLFCGC